MEKAASSNKSAIGHNVTSIDVEKRRGVQDHMTIRAQCLLSRISLRSGIAWLHCFSSRSNSFQANLLSSAVGGRLNADQINPVDLPYGSAPASLGTRSAKASASFRIMLSFIRCRACVATVDFHAPRNSESSAESRRYPAGWESGTALAWHRCAPPALLTFDGGNQAIFPAW